MIRLSTLFWLILMSATGFAMFAVKYEVQALADQLAQTTRQAGQADHELRVLDAEWAYLNRPEALAQMNQRYLSLAPIATKQLHTSVADIPMRVLPTAPVETVAAVAGIAAPAAPAAMQRSASSASQPATNQVPQPSSPAQTATLRRDRRARHSGGVARAGQTRIAAQAEADPPGKIAGRADRADRGESVMSAVRQFDDNPCRPRHFKPPPCTPVVPDGPAKRALDGIRRRLSIASAGFLVLFAMVGIAARRGHLASGANIAVPQNRPVSSGAAAAAGSRRHRRSPRQAAGDDTRQPLALCRSTADRRPRRRHPRAPRGAARSRPHRTLCQADLGQRLCVGQAPSDPRGGICGQPARDTGAAIRARRAPRLSLWRICCRMWSAIPGSTTTDRPGSSGVSTTSCAAGRSRCSCRSTCACNISCTKKLQRVVDDFTAKGAAGLIMNVNTGEVVGDGVAAGFRSEPSRHARSQPPEYSDSTADVRPGHARRLRDRLGVQDLHDGDGARFRRHDDDRGVRRDAIRSGSAASRSPITTASIAR